MLEFRDMLKSPMATRMHFEFMSLWVGFYYAKIWLPENYPSGMNN